MKKISNIIVFSCLVLYSCKTQTVVDSEVKANQPDRKILGVGQPYIPTLEYETSLAVSKQRSYAWSVVLDLIRPAPIQSDIASIVQSEDKKIPLWQTFYEEREMVWMFRDLFNQQKAQASDDGKLYDFCPDKLSNIFEDHANKQLAFNYPKMRFDKRLNQVKNKQILKGLSGNGTTLFSPAIAFHYFADYQKIYSCSPGKIDSMLESSPPSSSSSHSDCMSQEFPGTRENYYKGMSKNFNSNCSYDKDEFKGFIKDKVGSAVAVKASWQIVDSEQSIRAFDTSASSMKNAILKGDWANDDANFVQSQSLNNNDIFTIEMISNNDQDTVKFQLTAIHFLVKNSQHWDWISLWWSPDSDSDFGADRPEVINQFDAWKNYKMCYIRDFRQVGSDSQDEINQTLEEVSQFTDPYTWCSNPHIELGDGNARTNCVGCHQHAGTEINPDSTFDYSLKANKNEAIDLNDFTSDFKGFGNELIRLNFPGDYLWSFTSMRSEMAQIISQGN